VVANKKTILINPPHSTYLMENGIDPSQKSCHKGRFLLTKSVG
jgi:hypothetical protein